MRLKIHGHPQKEYYESPAEYPAAPFSPQGHWHDANNPVMGVGMEHDDDVPVSHVHLEPLRQPIYAELPHDQPFVLDYRIQMFQFAGKLWGTKQGNPGGIGSDGIRYGLDGYCVKEIQWDAPDPVVGDPTGLVIRTLKVVIDPTLPFKDGGGGEDFHVPVNGWFHSALLGTFFFDSGPSISIEAWTPFYAVGDPMVPESHAFRDRSGFDFQVASRVAIGQNGNFHGTARVEYRDVYLPILAPIQSKWDVPVVTLAYARKLEWPTPELDRCIEINDADLHNHHDGVTVQEIFGQAGIEPQINAVITFDPAVGAGTHKKTATWLQDTGPMGNAMLAPNERLQALLGVTYTVWNGMGEPPPTQPPPVIPPPPSGVSMTTSVQHLGWGPGQEDAAVATVYDDQGIVKVVRFALDGGMEQDGTFDGNNWSRFMTLGMGTHTVVITAYDGMGMAVASETQTVSR